MDFGSRQLFFYHSMAIDWSIYSSLFADEETVKTKQDLRIEKYARNGLLTWNKCPTCRQIHGKKPKGTNNELCVQCYVNDLYGTRR